MIKLLLRETIEAMSGLVRGVAPTRSVTGVTTDSRAVAAGELFFALRGENADGHEFAPAALRAGAAGAVIASSEAPRVADAVRGQDAAGVLIEVDDPRAALGRLAAFHRRLGSARVVAVAGSNGKTTTKSLIDHLLRGRFRGACSPKSFNNDIGVPLTMLSSQSGDDYLIVEIGTNAPGEIAQLTALARPDVGVITCIGEEHLAGLGDLDGVAREETALLATMPRGGFAAINVDWPRIREFLPDPGPALATFGAADSGADLRVTRAVQLDPGRDEGPWLEFELNGRWSFRLPVLGAFNAWNAAAAVLVARRFGMDYEEIAARMPSFVPPPMRAEALQHAGATIINDAYNANPHSALAAIETLESLPARGRRVFVFGEMRELGAHAASLHLRVARRLRTAKIDHIMLVGAAVALMAREWGDNTLFGPTVEHCETLERCAERLAESLRPGDVALLKASRSIGLDRVVAMLRTAAPQPAASG